MNWLNIELPTLRSEQFLGSEPVERATWLCLMAYCADQENGGTMKACGEWGDRKWQQIVGVTAKETRAPSELWSWDGMNLRVWGYPVDKEAEVIANRENGRKGGRPRKTASQETQNKPSGFESLNQVVPDRLNGKERKGKEGKEKEEERKVEPRAKTPPMPKEFMEFIESKDHDLKKDIHHWKAGWGYCYNKATAQGYDAVKIFAWAKDNYKFPVKRGFYFSSDSWPGVFQAYKNSWEGKCAAAEV